MTEWKSFKDEWPKCEWIWIAGTETVGFLSPQGLSKPVVLKHYADSWKWAEAKLEYPPLPEKKRHSCIELSPNPISSCSEDQNGRLELEILTMTGCIRAYVAFCPFCGWSKEKR